MIEELLKNTWEELVGRQSGPLFLRLILQPVIASILAFQAGWNDVREGKPVFLLAIVREPSMRRVLMRDAWKGIGKLFLVAMSLDVIYQLVVLHGVRPLQTLIVATVSAVIPYILVRGLTNRVISATSLVNKQRLPTPEQVSNEK